MATFEGLAVFLGGKAADVPSTIPHGEILKFDDSDVVIMGAMDGSHLQIYPQTGGTYTSGTGIEVDGKNAVNLDLPSLTDKDSLDGDEIVAVYSAATGDHWRMTIPVLLSDYVPTFGDQAANKGLFGPESGADDEPTFRYLVGADIPSVVTRESTTGFEWSQTVESDTEYSEMEFRRSKASLGDVASGSKIWSSSTFARVNGSWQETSRIDSICVVDGTTGVGDLQIYTRKPTLGLTQVVEIFGNDIFLGGVSATRILSTNSTNQLVGLSRVPVVHGGTDLNSYAKGDILYSSATNTLAALSGNTTTTKKFLTQTGSGSASAAPAWDTIATGDLPGGAWISATAGETVMGANWTIDTASGDNWDTDGPTISLPAAGTYWIWFTVRVVVDIAVGSRMRARFYNVTDSAVITNSERMLWYANSTGQIQTTVTSGMRITVDSADTIRLEVARTGTFTTTLIASGGDGRSVFGYEQVA